MFKDLKGKQIWHITAPEDVSLSGLSQLAMDKAREGVAVLDHEGKSYGLSSTESTKSEREVLIPSSNGYKSVINLPRLSSKQADQDTGSAAAASITASTIRAVKPQRKGLKMRFFPSGFEGSAPTTLGTSDSEDDGSIPEPAGLGIPKGLDLPAKKEKRKHEQANGEEGIESPTKKHKKHRTAEEQHKRDEKKAKKERKKEKGAAKAKS
ncbi:hypothetical protein N0V90_010363 [Kalmusia sp. IMI 367209]|nr:hypothetical protein N0V90_010363 [Kalmusia sp. IMI 367209]